MNHGTNIEEKIKLFDRLTKDVGHVILAQVGANDVILWVQNMSLEQIELILSHQGNIENIDGDLRIIGQKKRRKNLDIKKIQQQFNNLTEEILC